MSIIDSRTDKQKAIQALQDISSVAQPYSLGLRGGGRSGISPATAYKTKYLVELLPKLSPEDLQELRDTTYVTRTGRTVKFSDYIQRIESLGGQKKAKEDQKNISATGDQYAELVLKIRQTIEDFLVEQEIKISNNIKNNWQLIHEQYKTLSQDEFQKKYGEKKFYKAFRGQPQKEYYSLSKFWSSNLGVLLRMKSDRLPEFIAKAQKAYREKEYGKIDGLIYKLKARYPSLTNFIMTNYRKGVDGIEFTLTADSPDGKVVIYTQTIYAGGYNIQRLHLRWLMHVNDTQGNRFKIEQG
jgi:hypothetical protein